MTKIGVVFGAAAVTVAAAAIFSVFNLPRMVHTSTIKETAECSDWRDMDVIIYEHPDRNGIESYRSHILVCVISERSFSGLKHSFRDEE